MISLVSSRTRRRGKGREGRRDGFQLELTTSFLLPLLFASSRAAGGDADYFADEDDEGRMFGGGLNEDQKVIFDM